MTSIFAHRVVPVVSFPISTVRAQKMQVTVQNRTPEFPANEKRVLWAPA
jgi:hypothetical protein